METVVKNMKSVCERVCVPGRVRKRGNRWRKKKEKEGVRAERVALKLLTNTLGFFWGDIERNPSSANTQRRKEKRRKA